MKRMKFTEGQIVTILKEAESGIPVEDLSRKHGFSKSAFYKWKSKYSGIVNIPKLVPLESRNSGMN